MHPGRIKVMRLIARLNIGGPAQHVIFLTEGLDPQKAHLALPPSAAMKGKYVTAVTGTGVSSDAGYQYDSVLVYGALDEGEGDMSYLVKQRGIRSIFIPSFGRKIALLGDVLALIDIFKTIKKEKPAIIHTHTAKAGTLGRIAAVLAGVPIRVHTYHGHVFHGYFGRAATMFFLFIEKALSKFTDRIVAISENQKEELLNKYHIGKADKYTIISLGFEVDRFLSINGRSGIFREKYGFKNDDILIGIVGRLVPVKNISMFIEAARLLKERLSESDFRRLKFIIIGDGPEKEKLMKLTSELGLGGSMFYAGWIKDIDKVYADLDIVGLTSDNEGTPLSLIEAMASGKPVISTDVGGVKDVVGGTGVLVPAGDAAGFADGLLDLANDKEKRFKISRDGRNRVMVKYSKNELLKNMDNLYAELLTMKGMNA